MWKGAEQEVSSNGLVLMHKVESRCQRNHNVYVCVYVYSRGKEQNTGQVSTDQSQATVYPELKKVGGE